MPIPLNAYKKALTRIYYDALDDEYKQYAEVKSEEDILKSSIYSAIEFDRKAENSFLRNAYKTLGKNKIQEYQKMVKEFGLVKIDAMDSIHKKQVEIREMLKKVLEAKGVVL